MQQTPVSMLDLNVKLQVLTTKVSTLSDMDRQIVAATDNDDIEMEADECNKYSTHHFSQVDGSSHPPLGTQETVAARIPVALSPPRQTVRPSYASSTSMVSSHLRGHCVGLSPHRVPMFTQRNSHRPSAPQ